jgi:hypothetical protein
MPGDKTKHDYRDRDRVSADDDYEVRHFAKQNGIDLDQVPELIRKAGNKREDLIEAAKELRKRS